MIGFLLRRLAQAALAIVVAVALIFLAIRVLPGNPLLTQFGQHTDPEQMAKIREEQGWNRPLPIQLVDFFWELATTGSLGNSIARSHTSVSEELAQRIPPTIELSIAALLIALPLGVALGVAAAVWRNRWPDFLCTTSSLIGVSVPVFFLGICLKALLTGMPSSNQLPLGTDFQSMTGFVLPEAILRGRFDVFVQGLRHLCLPAIALSSIPLAIVARITRSSMLEVLSADYVRTARAKGGSAWRVVLRHAFPNASVPVANIAGLQVGLLLSGAVLTETVFNWPGLGTYIVQAVQDSDYVVVQGCAFVVAVMFVTMNLLVDVLHLWLDPRLRSP
ncbi:MAG: ABC transporter permease [Pirellulaceae bacterium]